MSEDEKTQEEETIKSAEEPELGPEDVELAFSVIKLKGGKVLVQALDGLDSGSPSEIYGACNEVLRTLDAQHIAQVFHSVMLQAAEQVQAQPGRTESGLVVPS